MTWLAIKAWFGKAMQWVKEHWRWLLFPLGILLFLLGRLTTKKTITISSPELTGAVEVKELAHSEAMAKEHQAEVVKDEKLKVVDSEHAAAVNKLEAAEKAKVTELEHNPDELNKFLLQAGKDVR